jgi:hypothetical protein
VTGALDELLHLNGLGWSFWEGYAASRLAKPGTVPHTVKPRIPFIRVPQHAARGVLIALMLSTTTALPVADLQVQFRRPVAAMASLRRLSLRVGIKSSFDPDSAALHRGLSSMPTGAAS